MGGQEFIVNVNIRHKAIQIIALSFFSLNFPVPVFLHM